MWIIANWKSNKTIAEALDWVSLVGPQIPKAEQLKVVVCPSFSALSEVKKAIVVGNFPLMVGVQDLSPYGVGGYTGEEPAQLLQELASLAILGHSERRQNFGENDAMIAQKVDQAFVNNITPLVCVQSVDTTTPSGCKLVAYEPIFAIGTGNPDSPQNADSVAGLIKEKHGQDMEVLYGGSITAENAKGFTEKPNISGILVGKSSLDAQEFINICKVCWEKF